MKNQKCFFENEAEWIVRFPLAPILKAVLTSRFSDSSSESVNSLIQSEYAKSMKLSNNFFRLSLLAILFCALASGQSAQPRANASSLETEVLMKNSWQGITPLRSSTTDVARMMGLENNSPEGTLVGPFKVEDGEVTFSYLTPSLAKIYRAPAALTNKVFTIYLKPAAPLYRADLKLDRSFKPCVEEGIKGVYYLVTEAGVAYQIKRSTDMVETIIYQPSRAEVRRFAVNTECVF
jgi:hypothetical protein